MIFKFPKERFQRFPLPVSRSVVASYSSLSTHNRKSGFLSLFLNQFLSVIFLSCRFFPTTKEVIAPPTTTGFNFILILALIQFYLY